MPFFLAAQLEPVGNFVFTDVQRDALATAFANPAGNFPDNTAGYFDDTADLNTRAEHFRTDMSTSGVDRGAFVGFHSGRALIPRYIGDAGITVMQDPFPPAWTTTGYGPLYSNRNIHAAALMAYAENDTVLAGYVLTALLARANDNNLDASNGGSQRISGEPTRTNSTHGTSERFPFGRQEDFRAVVGQNPWFMLSSKMEQYLISYSIIFDLVKNTTNYTNNANVINYWFNDYYRFAINSATIHTNYWLGSNWRNFQQNYARPTLIFDNRPAFSGPSTVLYNVSTAAAQGLTNRSADSFGYIHLFGETFNVAAAKSFGYDIFRAVMAIAVYADGTFHEHYRWDANPDYVYTHIVKFMFMAHTNEVGVQKGLLPTSDANKFYGYTTSMGTNELFNGGTFSSTSGGSKNLRLVLTNLSRYYRLPANGGFEGVRYRANGSAYSTSHVSNLPQAIFLSKYPNDTEIDDFKNYRSSAGYTTGLNASMQANGQTPHSLGLAWGFGQAIGGHIAFGTFNAFSGVSVEGDPVGTPTSGYFSSILNFFVE